MKILHLTLKKKWFDLVASGEKKYEYRECKPYWEKRLLNNGGDPNQFDVVRFKNGYGKGVPSVDVEFKGIAFTSPEWCIPEHGEILSGITIVIKLGRLLAQQSEAKDSGISE